MNELRWILLGFAIVLLAGIYLWGRRASAEASKREASLRARPEPGMFSHEPAATGPEYDDESRHADTRQVTSRTDAHLAAKGEEPTLERPIERDTRHARVEPRFSDSFVTEELPVESDHSHTTQSSTAATGSTGAPTLSSGDSPPPKRIERRKILSLRLSASPHRIEGARLLSAFETEGLQHGKYAVYHRLHEDGASMFSVASMVEPGTFDLETMPQTQYPGITLFAQLPGPVPGMHALNELVACARRLQQSLGGTLQDERGVPLTVHRIERMRQEVRDFERPTQAGSRSGTNSPTARL